MKMLLFCFATPVLSIKMAKANPNKLKKWLENENKIQTIEIIVLVQATILGFVLGEIWYLSQAVGSALSSYIQFENLQFIAHVLCVITVIIICIYFFIRGGCREFKKFLKSRRIDIFVLIGLGINISVIVGGVGTPKYQEYVGK